MRANASDTPRNPSAERSRRSKGSALARYLDDIRDYPMLDRDQEVELARAVREDRPGAFERLIECNLRFVVKVAREFRSHGLPLEDLINEGNLGLMEAARRFDPDRGVKFTSWAVWWIRRSIHGAIANQTHVVRLPGSQIRRMRQLQAAEATLTGELGREPRLDELADKLPSNLAGLDPIHCHGVRMTRLDDPLCEDSRESVAASLKDDRLTSPENALIEEEAATRVQAAYDALDAQQKQVVRERFGLEGSEPMTLAEVARRMGRSPEGVRQIEMRAMARLRRRYMAPAALPLRVPRDAGLPSHAPMAS